jgi:3-hydroxyacyl-[acyl-carrier-protein] dehydratase
MIDAILEGLKQCRKNDDGSLFAEVEFSPESLVFAGHFPGNPILPGICQMEAIKIILEKSLNIRCQLLQFSSAKFFKAVVPGETASFTISISSQTGENINVTAKVSSNNIKVSEFKASYRLE